MTYQIGLFDEAPPAPRAHEVLTWTVGEDCPIPGYFPSGGGDPQKAQRVLELIQQKNWRELQRMGHRWWCRFCGSWHNYDQFFFDSFDGVYPHEMVGEAWKERFGGWEAEFRRELGFVGMATEDVLRQVTHAQYYAYWAERTYEGDLGRSTEEGTGAHPGDQRGAGELGDSVVGSPGAD